MSDPSTATPQPPPAGARKATASAGAPSGAQQSESPLEKAKRLAAVAESDTDQTADDEARRNLLMQEIADFEQGKRGAQAQHDTAVRALDEALQGDLDLFDQEIAERQRELNELDGKSSGSLPTSPASTDGPRPPADQGSQFMPWSAKAKEKTDEWASEHPKAARRIKSGGRAMGKVLFGSSASPTPDKPRRT
jgi:hypothetical protein